MSTVDTDLLQVTPIEIDHLSDTRARVVLTPLERGYGHTIGNALRRILLSSMPGAAITEVTIDGALHEYSTLPGVREDLLNICLNLKGVAVRLNAGDGSTMRLVANGPGDVCARDFITTQEVEIANPDHHICTLNDDGSISLEAVVSRGRGYQPADQPLFSENERIIGQLRLDASYSPMRSVDYTVENTRVEQRTDMDKLILTLESNGTIRPEEAVKRAATILTQQLAPFVDLELLDEVEKQQQAHAIDPFLFEPVDTLGLSVRCVNCLHKIEVSTVGEIVQQSEKDLLSTPNLGKTTLDEIKQALAARGLTLDMTVPGWESHARS